jgi:hypothetical protein
MRICLWSFWRRLRSVCRYFELGELYDLLRAQYCVVSMCMYFVVGIFRYEDTMKALMCIF